MEVRGYAAAADWVYREAHERRDRDELLTMTELRSIHTVAMTPVWDVAPHASATDREAPGSFREHDIARFPGGMTPPTWPLVASEISQWLRSVSMIDASTIEFPEQLASIHHKFETIHPFLDGNGRTGRLVLNLLLVRNGYPPVVILKSERSKYLSCLRRADKGDIGALGEFIARAILRSLVRFVVPSMADDATLVLIAALETKDLSVGALRIAAVRGRLRAVKGSDGRWRSTKRWVEQYVKSLHVRQSD